MRHDKLLEACNRNNLPAALTRSILREHEGLSCQINVGAFTSMDDVPFLSGGNQGGRNTRKLWCLYLMQAMKTTLQLWEVESRVWMLDGASLNYAVWADDIVVYAATHTQLVTKLQDLLTALSDFGLDFKEDGLCWSCDASFPYGLEPITLAHPTKGAVDIPFEPKVNILGTAFDHRGSSETSLEHRLKQAWQHWHERKS